MVEIIKYYFCYDESKVELYEKHFYNNLVSAHDH